VLGAQEVTKLADSCRKLQALVHVSTAYVNGMRQGLPPERVLRPGDCIALELPVGENRTRLWANCKPFCLSD
jgi:hypothetical protein